MRQCQSRKSYKILPRTWLMSDPRFGDRLYQSVQKLPRGSGVIMRHYDDPNRQEIYKNLARICRRRGLKLILAGDAERCLKYNAEGYYYGRPQKIRKRYNSITLFGVHDEHEIRKAQILGADAYMVSPIYSTNSHKGQRPLGLLRFRKLSRLCDKPVIALGGMNQARFHSIKHVHGFAAIDGLIR